MFLPLSLRARRHTQLAQSPVGRPSLPSLWFERRADYIQNKLNLFTFVAQKRKKQKMESKEAAGAAHWQRTTSDRSTNSQIYVYHIAEYGGWKSGRDGRSDKQIDLSAISLPRAHVHWSRGHKANLLIVLTINFLYCALFIYVYGGTKPPASRNSMENVAFYISYTCYSRARL